MLGLRFCVASTLAFGWLVTATHVGLAEDDHHHHRRGVAKHRIGIQIYSPTGVRVTDHQDQYRFVVPSTGRYGSFYSHDNARYYTPPVARIVGQQAPPAPRPVELKFGGFQKHAELAERLETLANQLCLDLHANYQDNPDFDEVYGLSYKLLQAAKYVHGKEHAGDKAAIQQSVNSIDEAFHHVQRDIRDWRSANRRQVGPMNLAATTEEFEAVLHHLMFDLGVKPSHDEQDEEPPLPEASAPREDAPPPRRR